MRKIYSLLAMFLVAMMANAQVLVNYEHTADVPAGITLGGTTVMASVGIHTNADKVDCIQLKNGYTSNSALNGNAIEVAVEGGFKAGDVVEIAGFVNIKEEDAASKNGKFVIYVLDSSDSGYNVLWTSEDLINGRLSADEPRVDTYTLEQDCEKFYIARSGNTGTNLYSLKVTRAEAPAGPSSFEATITSDPEDIYYSGYQSFDMQQVMAALGLANEAELEALLAAEGNVYMKLASGELTNVYTGNANEFWMNIDGAPQGYGAEGTCWFAGLYYEPAGTDEETGESWESEFTCRVGQMPKYFSKIHTDSEGKVVLVLKNGDKQIEVAITLKVNAAPVLQLEEPTTSYAALNVVKEYEMVLNYTLGGQYEGRTDSLVVEGIYEALDTDAASLAAAGDQVFMARIMGTDESSSNVWTDELKPSRFDTDGWFGRYSSYNEATGEETPIVQNAPHGWGAGCTFYLQNAQITDGVFTIKNGQYPGTMKVGDADYAEIFVCNGTKAVKITVKAVVKEPEVDPDQPDDEPEEDVPFDQMTKAGEQNVAIEVGAYDYYPETDVVSFDLDEILNALGASSPEDIKAWVYENESSLVDPSTNDYWQNENGMTEGWSGTATEGGAVKVYFKDSNIQTGKMVVMQRATRYSSLEEVYGPFTLKYVFTYGDKYYELNIAYSVNPIKEDKEYKQVASESITKQIIPGTVEYNGTEKTSIDLDYITGAIGTSDFTLYADLHKTAEDGSTTLEWSNKYTCTPAPGFWFGKTQYTNEEGQVVVDNAGWGNNAFGFTYSNGTITWYEYPGACTVGESYAANVYFVNEETGAYLKFTINVEYVDEIRPEAETVGEEKILVEAKEATADGTYKVVLDMTKAYEALGISADEIEAAQIVAPKSQFTFAYFEPEEDIIYDANGYVTSNEEAIVAMANLAIEDGIPTLVVDPMDIDLTAEEATSVTVRLGLEYNGKRYIHVVTLGNATYTAINGVKSTSNAAAIYTINGVKVNALQKGLNIMKMTDGTVKKVLVK